MPNYELKLHKIFIASPGGLESERLILRKQSELVNTTDSEYRGLRFKILGYEDAEPDIGRPQDLINPLLYECDSTILVLQDRWGSSPSEDKDWEYSSGSEEEFAVAMDCFYSTEHLMSKVCVFFKSPPAEKMERLQKALSDDPAAELPEDLEQLKKVLDFKDKAINSKKLLFKDFSTDDDFLVLAHAFLCKRIREHDGTEKTVKKPISVFDIQTFGLPD